MTEFREATPESILAYYRATGAVYEQFASLPQPTLAAIHGWCVGGGLELSLAADFRIADESARFKLPEVAIGIIPSSGGTHRLVRLLGTARAKELVFLRERIDAAEAFRIGLVTEVVAEGTALDRAVELASRSCRATRARALACEGGDRRDGGVVARRRSPDRARRLRGARTDARRAGSG